MSPKRPLSPASRKPVSNYRCPNCGKKNPEHECRREKEGLKLAALPLDYAPEALEKEFGWGWYKLPWQDRVTLIAYFDNTNRPPKNFPANSDGFRQWTFTGRKKGDKDLLDKTLKGE